MKESSPLEGEGRVRELFGKSHIEAGLCVKRKELPGPAAPRLVFGVEK